MNLNKPVIRSAIASFLEKTALYSGRLAEQIEVYENPTDEIRYAATERKKIALFARGGRMLASSRGAKARLEENYLYDSRLFGPTATTVNLIPGEYLFFQNAVGQPATNNGFVAAACPQMTEVETNMDVAGQIAQGKNFVFNQIGVSFNSDIATPDCQIMMESGALRFEKQGGQFTLRHGPIRLWPGGTGVAGYAATAVGGAPLTIDSAHNGSADIRSARKLSIPRVIREKDSFNYKYIVPRGNRNTAVASAAAIVLSANLVMTIWLWGGQQDNIPV